MSYFQIIIINKFNNYSNRIINCNNNQKIIIRNYSKIYKKYNNNKKINSNKKNHYLINKNNYRIKLKIL